MGRWHLNTGFINFFITPGSAGLSSASWDFCVEKTALKLLCLLNDWFLPVL